MALSTVSNFPAAFDTLPLVQPGDTLATAGEEHDLLHNLIANTIAQIEQKLGINGSVSSSSLDYMAHNHQHQGTDNSAQLSRLPIRMTASQSLNPLEIQDSGMAIRSAITPAGEFLDIGLTGSTLALRSYVIGDTQDRWQVQADGTIKWGPGGSTVSDTSLRRTGAGALQVSSMLGIGITPSTFALDVSGTARFSGAVTLSGGLSAPLAVAQGGTGSATQNFVDLSTDQTIGGIKTFSSTPVFTAPLGIASGGTGSVTQNFVDLSVAQTIGGTKTFSVAPVFNAPLGVASGGTGSATKNFVDLTTAQTIAGVKTFSSAPVFPAGSLPESAVANLTTDLAAKANANAVVSSFNSRTGAVSLSSADVTGALAYTPVNKAGDTMSGPLQISGTNDLRFSTYGGGWFMNDSTWIRAYGNKSMYTAGEVRADLQFSGVGGGQPKLIAAATTPAALVNAWSNYTGAFALAGYRQGPDGMVYVSGLVANAGSPITTVFTLPASMKPAHQRGFIVCCQGGYARVDVLTTGEVQVAGYATGANAQFLFLDNIMFHPNA